MKKYNVKQNDAIIKQDELNDMIKLLEEKINIREDELYEKDNKINTLKLKLFN